MQIELEKKIVAQVDSMRDRDVILAFSTGADSLACYLRMREWGIKPAALVYMQYIPRLPMIENYIRYFESVTGEKVYRIPSVLGTDDLRNGLYQRPGVGQRMNDDSPLSPKTFNKDQLNAQILAAFPRNPVLAVGLRYTEGYFRFRTLMEYGPLRGTEWNPGASLTMQETAAIIRNYGKIKLPYEYRFLGRSFESPRASVALAMAKKAPETWNACRAVYPMIHLLEAQAQRIKIGHDINTRIKCYGSMSLEQEVGF
jgi:hypothetical protein